MKLRPVGERIIVKPIAPEKQSKGGVLLPDEAQQEQQRGVVRAKGPGMLHEASGYRTPIDVPIGATVVYSKFAGAKIQVEDEEHLVLREQDVLAVEEDGTYEA